MLLLFNGSRLPNFNPQTADIIRFGWPITSFRAVPPPPAVVQPAGSAQQVKVYLGPTLGWRLVPVVPQRFVSDDTAIAPGDCVLLVNAVASMTIQLPDVVAWVKEPHYNPFNAFERTIWIKDYVGNAAAFNYTVLAKAGQKIDSQPQAQLAGNHSLMRLYPLNDLTGWFIG